MAIFKQGSLRDFAIKVRDTSLRAETSLKEINSIRSLSKAINQFELITSQESRGLALKSVELLEGFEGIFGNALNEINELYFIAWAWDLSGNPVYNYPTEGVSPTDIVIPVQVGKVREFIGEGINLFPKRIVKGGIAIRIQIWESDEGVRAFGKILSEVSDTIKNSQLNSILSVVSSTFDITTATITLIENAALELTNLLGVVLNKNADDYVDFFEGYYASNVEWKTGSDLSRGTYANITLNKY